MLLSDLFDVNELEGFVNDGYIRVQHHSTLPLSIYNYTEKTSYSRTWTPITNQCRGLIVNHVTGEVVARPMPKFHNYGEQEAEHIDLGGVVCVTDKLDGSCGIGYPTPDGYAFATRGSFASEQAFHATNLLRRNAPDWRPPSGLTPICEIIYPNNRIVVDYGSLDTLVLLGWVEIETGDQLDWHWATPCWPFDVAETFPYRTFLQALEAPDRPNREGLVVYFLGSGDRIKLKQADYLQLHRLVTGTTARVLWEHLAVNACEPHCDTEALIRLLRLGPDRIERVRTAGVDWETSFAESVPDELYDWFSETVSDLRLKVSYLRHEIEQRHKILIGEAKDDRREYALMAKTEPHSGALFSIRDGRSIEPYLWASVRPSHEVPFRTINGDAS